MKYFVCYMLKDDISPEGKDFTCMSKGFGAKNFATSFFSSTEKGKNVPPKAKNVLRPHHPNNHPNNRFSCKTNKTSKKHSLTEAAKPKAPP